MAPVALLLLLAASPEATRLAEEAAAFAQAGDLAKATERLEQAVALEPNDATLLYNVAQLREATGNRAGALEAYEKYLKVSPQARDADDVRQRVVRLRGQVSASDPALREAFLRAQAFVRLGRHDEAERELTAILEKQPSWPEALKSRALLREQRQQYEAALEDLRRYARVADPAEQVQVDQRVAELSIKAMDQHNAREAEARRQKAEAEAQQQAAAAAARQAEWERQQAAAAAAAAAENARVQALRARASEATGRKIGLIIGGGAVGLLGVGVTTASIASAVRGQELNETLRAGMLTQDEMTSTVRAGRDANSAAIGLGVLGGILVAGAATMLGFGIGTKVPGEGLSMTVSPLSGGAFVGVMGGF